MGYTITSTFLLPDNTPVTVVTIPGGSVVSVTVGEAVASLILVRGQP